MSGGSMFNTGGGFNDYGVATIVCTFQTNNASDPDTTLIYGPKVASITYVSTGKYLVTLTDGFRRVLFKDAELDDSADDGAYATIASVDDTASPLAFNIYTRAATGTKTNYTGRALTFHLDLKTSLAGG